MLVGCGLEVSFFCVICVISTVMISDGLLFLYCLNVLGLVSVAFGFLCGLLMVVLCVVWVFVGWFVVLKCLVVVITVSWRLLLVDWFGWCMVCGLLLVLGFGVGCFVCIAWICINSVGYMCFVGRVTRVFWV